MTTPYILTLFENEKKADNLYFNIKLNIVKPPQYAGNYTLNVNITNNVLALIDTGASICGISKRTVKSMGLEQYRVGDFTTASGGGKAPTYLFDVIFPNNKTFENIEAVEVSDPSENHIQCDFLIGMNILRQGDIAFTSENGKMCFSFICPPREKYIDFNSYK